MIPEVNLEERMIQPQKKEELLDQQEIQSCLKVFQDKIPNIQNYPPETQSVILIGPSRSGKSTVSRILAGSQVIKIAKSSQCYTIEGEGISSKTKSYDTYPKMCETTLENGQNALLWDTPPFQFRKYAISMHKLFQIHQRVKIILVLPLHIFFGLSQQLFESLRTLIGTFEHISQIKNNLGFLITNVDQLYSAKNIQEYIKQRILSCKENVNLTPQIKQILAHMSVSENMITMNRPNKEYEDSRLYYQDFSKECKLLIQKLKFIENPQIRINS